MAPNPGISGNRGDRITLATPETCKSVTFGTSLVAPPAISTAISMLELPVSLKDICSTARPGSAFQQVGDRLYSIQCQSCCSQIE